MKALITGASSGLGEEIAKILSKQGYDLILVARREERLKKLKNILNTDTKIIVADLSVPDNCKSLYEQVKKENIDVLINNAGFGLYGSFISTDLDKELEMINTNIKAVHILTKLFLNDFKNRNYGYILNVSSSASFFSGPLMSTYYATKNYITRLTEAIYQELKSNNIDVYVGVLCPGPFDTEFNKIANVKTSLKSLSSKYVANYAVKKMFKKKLIIIPNLKIKLVCFISRFIPRKTLLKINYSIQNRKK